MRAIYLLCGATEPKLDLVSSNAAPVWVQPLINTFLRSQVHCRPSSSQVVESETGLVSLYAPLVGLSFPWHTIIPQTVCGLTVSPREAKGEERVAKNFPFIQTICHLLLQRTIQFPGHVILTLSHSVYFELLVLVPFPSSFCPFKQAVSKCPLQSFNFAQRKGRPVGQDN